MTKDIKSITSIPLNSFSLDSYMTVWLVIEHGTIWYLLRNVTTEPKLSYTNLLEKYPTFFLRNPSAFQWSALAWGDLESSYLDVILCRLSIASVIGKQHFFFLVKTQTLVARQSPYSPDITRFHQKNLNQVHCSSRSVTHSNVACTTCRYW